MINEILMPALSPTMTEGTLAKWIKKEGDQILAGDVIAEIETDKATMEVEAVDEGILGKILISEGAENVPVNSVIALILEEGSDKSELENYSPKSSTASLPIIDAVENKTQNVSSQNQSEANESNERVFSSPLARRIAEQNNINISTIQGSGPKGRVVKADVEDAIKSTNLPSYNSANRIVHNHDGGFDLEPISGMRKIIAKRLVESKTQIPHFYLNIECNLDKLLKLRSEINEGSEKENRISVNDLVIKATALAMKEVPDSNASWSDEGIKKYRNIDISVAVAIEGGLITPIIKSADMKLVSDISSEMKDLARRARDGKLKPEEYQGGNLSISNLGMYGIKQFNAIINPPQSCILAIGAGMKRAIVNDKGEIISATMCDITLSCDHRVVDGAVGANLLSALKDFLENPIRMLV